MGILSNLTKTRAGLSSYSFLKGANFLGDTKTTISEKKVYLDVYQNGNTCLKIADVLGILKALWILLGRADIRTAFMHAPFPLFKG